MSFITAITGKGGVGKTTIAAILISRMIAGGYRPVLAIDADPNSCLDFSMGVRVNATIGSVREDAKAFAQKGMSEGIDKQRLLQLKINESLLEGEDFDLIAMGRPEGPGCYCYANNILKEAISKMASQYPYVVIDNEAGLENLSRRIAPEVDLMIIVTDPSAGGFDTVSRLHKLSQEMGIICKRLAVAVNRTRREMPPHRLDALAKSTGADTIMTFPDDDEVSEYSEAGRNLMQLSAGNTIVSRIDAFIDWMKINNKD